MTIHFDILLFFRIWAAEMVAIVIHEHAHALAALALGQGPVRVGFGRVEKPVLTKKQVGPVEYLIHADPVSLFFGYYGVSRVLGWRHRVSAAAPLVLAIVFGAIWPNDAGTFLRYYVTLRTLPLWGLSFWGLVVGVYVAISLFCLVPMKYFRGMTSDGTRILARPMRSARGIEPPSQGEWPLRHLLKRARSSWYRLQADTEVHRLTFPVSGFPRSPSRAS